MTPTQTDYEVSDEAVRLLFDGSIKGADLRETIVKHIASYRLRCEAAAFEKAAGVADGVATLAKAHLDRGFPEGDSRICAFQEQVLTARYIARDIRKLAGEKHD